MAISFFWRALAICPPLLMAASAFPIKAQRVGGDTKQDSGKVPLMEIQTEPNGDRILLARWAIGTRANVQHLRIPMNYVNPISLEACSSRWSQMGEACKAGYAVDLTLDVKLSELMRVAGISPVHENPAVETHLFVRSVLQGTKNLSVRESKTIDIAVEKEMMTVGLGRKNMPVLSKGAAFGLHIIGLEHGSTSEIVPNYEEIFYDGETPLLSDHVVVCDEEKSSETEPSIVRIYTPQCEQYIGVDEISAVTKIRYGRENLGRWREIDFGARALLQGFIQRGH